MRYKVLDPNGYNFLTLTIVQWIDLFTRPAYCEIIIDSLKFCQKEKELLVHAFVIMPSHIHLIVSTPAKNGISPIIQSFKSFTANQILKYLKDKKQPESRREWLLNHFEFNARKDKTNSKHKIWQTGNHPISLYSPKVIQQKIEYIHQNPVKSGIVNIPHHYKYSSAVNFQKKEGLIKIDKIDRLWNTQGYIDMGY